MSATLSQRRIGLLVVLFGLLLAAGLARAFQLTTFDSGRLSSVATNEHTRTIVVPAPRGAILDRNGAMLAVDAAADDISATPQLIHNPITAATALAPLLHVRPSTIEEKLAHPTSREYTMLARQVPDATAQLIKALKIPGIALATDPLRTYPFRFLASQVIGDVGVAGSGLAGIEYEYNRVLAGTPGVQHVVYDASGRPISESGPSPQAGGAVQLTIDAALQQDAEHVLSATAARFHPLRATVIVMDPRTTTVLAMANWPRANANDTAQMARARNYATQLNYEPGSTFKVVAIGGALADGLISPSTKFLIPDSYHVADRVIHDDNAHPTEWMTTSKILAYSSNIGAVKIGQLLEHEVPGATNQMYNWVLRYGFGAPTGIDLPEQQGIVPPASTWSGSSIGNLPFGQGESVTPIQMATAYAAIANGGLLRTPHIVASVGGVPTPEPRAHRIFSSTVAAQLRTMLRGVLLPGGTAAEIQIPGYELAGKTGTAQKVVNGTYSRTDYVASFVGFAPARDPRIEALVVVDRPSNGYVFGAEVAAPAWKQIMDFALPYLKIAPR